MAVRRRKRRDLKGGSQAAAVYATLRAIFGWYAVLDEGYASPCVRGLMKLVRGAKTKSRVDNLTPAELKALWEAAEAEGGHA